MMTPAGTFTAVLTLYLDGEVKLPEPGIMTCECAFTAAWMIEPTSALPLASSPVTVYALASFGNAGTFEPATLAAPAPPGPEAVGEQTPLPPPPLLPPPPPPPSLALTVKEAVRFWTAPE